MIYKHFLIFLEIGTSPSPIIIAFNEIMFVFVVPSVYLAGTKYEVFENQTFANIRCIVSGHVSRSSSVRVSTVQLSTRTSAIGKYLCHAVVGSGRIGSRLVNAWYSDVERH